MVTIKPMKEIVRRLVRGSLEAFLDGKKYLNWIKGVIEKSGLLNYPGMLKNIFKELERYKTSPRYKEIIEECKKNGWL